MWKFWIVVCMFVAAQLPAQEIESEEVERHHEEFLIIPDDYDPHVKSPLMVVYQRFVDDGQLKGTPYFAAFHADPRIILEGAKKFNFDPFRIYATGFSRSGHGLLEQVWNFPHRYAAIAPVCNDLRHKGRYSEEGQKNLLVKYIQQTPTHLIHGDRDSFVKTGKRLYEYMMETNCPVIWSTYPGGHNPYGVYYRNMSLVLDFFDKHILNPWPKEVVHVVTSHNATRAFWVDSKMGELGSNQKAHPSWKVKVQDGNVIEVLHADDSVKALIFHLNENLVDMSKSLKVVWKEVILYDGAAKELLELKIHEGQAKVGTPVIPLWEQLQKFYETPQEAGAYDWCYFMMNTAFKDNRRDFIMNRRVFLDLGFRAVNSPDKEIIDPASKKFVKWDVMSTDSMINQDMSALKRKLPIEVRAYSQRFDLQGVVDSADAPAALVNVGEGKSGDVIVLKVCLENKGTTDVYASSQLNRTVFRRYYNKVFPKSGDGDNFYYGIWEMAGTRRMQSQFIKNKKHEPYQALAFVLLNPGTLPEAKQIFIEGCKWGEGFVGARRDFLLKAGERIEFPVLFMSAHAPDPHAVKPSYPDLGKVIDDLRPQIMAAYQEMGKN